jgi:hypothetical protein
MIEDASKQELQAVASLYYDSNFQVVLTMMRRSLTVQREFNDTAMGVPLHWSQGECQAYNKFLSLCEHAESRCNM